MNLNEFSSRMLRAAATLLWIVAVSACGQQGPEEQFAEAQRAFEAGDLRTASVAVRAVLQQQPDNLQARLLFAQVAFDAGDAKTAEAESRRVLSADANNESARALLVEALLVQERAQEALEELAKINSSARTRSITLLEIDGRLALGDVELASSLLSQLKAEGSDDPFVLLREARLLALLEDFDAARTALESALQKEPNSIELLLLAAEIDLSTGRYKAAADFYTTIATLAERKGLRMTAERALFSAATAKIQDQDWPSVSEAIKAYAESAGQQSVGVLFLKGSADHASGDLESALDYLTEANLLAPEDPQVLRLLGATHLAAGNLTDARRSLRAALARTERDVSTTQLLAQVYLQDGQTDAALTLVRGLDLTIPYNTNLLARTLLATGASDEAVALLEQLTANGVASRETQLLLAQAYASNKDVRGVERALQQQIAADDYKAVIGLMSAYIAAGENAKARVFADELVTNRSDDFRAYATAILFLLSVGELEDAAAYAADAVSRFPNIASAEFLSGQVAIAQNRVNDAERAFERTLQIEDSNVDAMLGLAVIFQRTQRRSEMVSILENAYSIAAADPRPALALARTSATEGEFVAARRYAEEAVKRGPQLSESNRLLGQILLRLGHVDDADRAFAAAVSRAGALPASFIELARLRAREEGVDAAKKVLARGEAQFPRSAELKVSRARLLLESGDYAGARTLVDRLLREDSREPSALALAGTLALIDADYGTARRRFEAALDAGAGPEAIVGLYQLELRQGRPAAGVLERGLSRYPDAPSLQIMLAQDHDRRGDAESAIAIYQRVLANYPDNPAVLNNVAWLLNKKKDPAALGYARQAVELAPDSAEILDTYGTILLDTGNASQAVSQFERAATLAPEAVEIRYNLARAYERAGNVDKALESARIVASDSSTRFAEPARQLISSLERDGATSTEDR